MLPAAAAALTVAPAEAAPSLTVAPQAGAPGDELTAKGAGFQPGAIGMHLDAVVVGEEVATGDVADDGTFQLAVTIPAVPDGPHQLIACRDISPNGDCREQAAAAFRIATPPVTTTTSPDVALVTTTSATTTTSPSFEQPTTAPSTSTTSPNFVISTTSAPLDEGQPPGEIIPDISVRGIEITQGIQDLSSRMPLVAGRRTTVRMHIDTSGGYVGAVDGALLVERPGEDDVVLYPDNGPIPPGLDRTEIDGALNFELDSDLYAAGEATFTAQAWSAGGASISDEPDSANNLRTKSVEFQTGENPTVWLVALDDGGGPGPDIVDVIVLLGFAPIVSQDLLDFMPIATIDFQAYPTPVLPGPEATEAGMWDLGLSADLDDTAFDRRHEPNQRMALLAELGGFLDDGTVLGLIDGSIPTDGYSGWAGYGVSWSKPNAGTPAHEVGHNQGLDHVNCLGDTDGDGISQEEEGGSIDWSHPTGFPPVCSLAPIDPDGFFGYTNYRSPVTIYSNDPAHPQAAFPFMSYQDPGWTDPYHWCRLLDSFGIPCNPTVLGLPPADPFQEIDCEPEEVGSDQLQLELCLAQEPADPQDAKAPGQIVAEVGTNAVGMEALEIQHAEFLFDIPLDPDSWLIAAGSVDLDAGNGTITQAASRDEISSMTGGRFALAIEGHASAIAPVGLALQLTAADGAALATVPVVIDGAGHGNGTDHGPAFGFFSPIPWVEGAVAIDLLVGGAVVDSLAISPTAPQVGGVEVETIGAARSPTVSWTVEDPDPGALDGMTYTVLWSADGETWIPAATDVTGSEASPGAASGEDSFGMWQINLESSAQLPGGDDIRVQVIANDGVRTGAATSATFAAPDLAPLMAITPELSKVWEDGVLRFEQDVPVELRAIVLDPETRGRHDGWIELQSVSWSTDGTVLGSGPVLHTRELSIGTHTISATTTDAAGNETTAEIVVEVVESTGEQQ